MVRCQWDIVSETGDGSLTSLSAAKKFADKINAHDVKGLIALMTDDHVFVDSLGNKSTRPAIEAGWESYFAMVPDYWIRVDREIINRDTVVLIGAAGGTYSPSKGIMKKENRWSTPAVWIVRISGERVAEWRIYSDNEPIRARMRASNPSSE
jgi:ketosteroid isomerase-like protein